MKQTEVTPPDAISVGVKRKLILTAISNKPKACNNVNITLLREEIWDASANDVWSGLLNDNGIGKHTMSK
jgi:hypothetical protein